MTFANGRAVDAAASNVFSVNSADLDGDGDMDVVAGLSIWDEVRWYQNQDGEGTFSELLEISPCCERDDAT